ncbi:MAG: hypothetical protein HZA90_08840 [Verrucomicrobia bacterium]|nr:hypothetical protein [Verrucomicrobiota bacterium]
MALLLCRLAAAESGELTVDFSKTNGLIRPLHGVNLGPLCYRGTVDLSAYHREIGVPLTRLHDVVWLNAEAVDIHTIFPDFRNDPAREESYDFRQTDDYVQSILNVGSQIVYRLGESIEHTSRKYRVNPPPDPEKWAAICVGLIRHYNDGWAGGFRHRLRYWEIWNEPDVRPSMWTGNDAQFFRLFEVTAKAIRARFPDVKVGGPAVGGTGHFAPDAFQPAPFMTNFLAYCRAHAVPLDFFSWHRYTSDPWDLPRRAKAVRQVLDSFDFKNTESHLNEWNYLPRDDWRPMLKDGQGASRAAWYAEMGGPAGAAFAATALMLLQDAPLDAANYYTGEIQGFGLFDIHGVPKKTFHAFRAFRRLLDAPVRVEAQGAATSERRAICAGVNLDKSQATVLVSCCKSGPSPLHLTLKNLPWNGASDFEVRMVDAAHDLEKVREGRIEGLAASLPLTFETPGVALVVLRQARR